MPDPEFNKLLISEMESLKVDMREGFAEVRKIVYQMNKELRCKSDDCSEKFLQNTTFWKCYAIILTLILGSYSYTFLID